MKRGRSHRRDEDDDDDDDDRSNISGIVDDSEVDGGDDDAETSEGEFTSSETSEDEEPSDDDGEEEEEDDEDGGRGGKHKNKDLYKRFSQPVPPKPLPSSAEATKVVTQALQTAQHRGVPRTESKGIEPPKGLNAFLQPHQLIGIEWLARSATSKDSRGAILADSMGLGKTMQTIGYFLQVLQQSPTAGPFVVMCPLSIVANWCNEIHRFAPSLSAVKLSGTREAREAQLTRVEAMTGPFVLILSYETFIMEAARVGKLPWHTLVVDEGHRLKNADSKLHRMLSFFFPRCWRLLLTGTPVQNNLKELFNLLGFVAPDVFENEGAFQVYFGDTSRGSKASTNVQHADQLRDLLRPFVLRRTLEDCNLQLPPLTETVVKCGLTALQRKLYLAVLEGNVNVLTGNSHKGINNVLVQLRKVCNHPYLFDGVEPEPFEEGDHIWQNAGKLRFLERLLPALKAGKHGVLIFSQSTGMLDIVQDYLSYRGYSYERLDGSVRGDERWNAVSRFQDSGSDTFAFLLSTRAGGVGLNLVAADTVVLLDSDWNPQMDLQAIARAHRIGQSRAVRVVRMVTDHTVEEVIHRRAMRKLQLSANVLRGSTDGGAGNFDGVTQSDFLQVVQFGLAHHLSHADDDDEKADEADQIAVTSILSDGPSLPLDGIASATQAAAPPGDPTQSALAEDDDTKSADGAEDFYVFDGCDYKQSRAVRQKDETALADLVSRAALKPTPKAKSSERKVDRDAASRPAVARPAPKRQYVVAVPA